MAKLRIVSHNPSLRNWGMACLYLDTETKVISIVELHVVQHVAPRALTKTNVKDLSSSVALVNAIAIVSRNFKPDLHIAELPYGSQTFKAAVGYGLCIGVLGSIPCTQLITVTPHEVKKMVGDGNPTKHDVVDWVLKHHPTCPFPIHNNAINMSKAEHMADAIVATHAALHTHKLIGYM